MRQLKLIEPIGKRSCGGIHPVPVKCIFAKVPGHNQTFVAQDLKRYQQEHGLSDDSIKTLVAELAGLLNQARSGTLHYSEDSSQPGTVSKIFSQSGLLELRLEAHMLMEIPLYVRLVFGEPPECDCILLLGLLIKRKYPAGKKEQNMHAMECQRRGDEWITHSFYHE